MVGKRLAWVLVTALVAGFVACGGESEPVEDCVPGDPIFCRCPGTSEEGTKTCKADGVTFEECTTPRGPCSEIEPETTSAGGSGPGAGGSPPQTDCRPGLEIDCRCENGDSGKQVCNDAGDGFGPCATADGECGAGVTTGSTGGGTGTLALYYPCGDDADCQSGLCPMGFCTTPCGSIDDCAGEFDATCARFQGGSLQVCAPFCDVTATCEGVYGEPSTCGFGLDPSDPGFYFTVCGDWLDELLPLDEGLPCGADEECNLGNDGLERVCDVDACVAGCYVDEDCAGSGFCDSDGIFPGDCF